ncbi:Hypothetical predicted protein [Paramuricea clavata]|uniref:Uncharacterized protein n=1 Tax=Paramuricea clavata TaxID=317549 RepID=A0A7D9DYK6_PARCT|nr:Hypothetical predicted protein [Paramuricea clavata]
MVLSIVIHGSIKLLKSEVIPNQDLTETSKSIEQLHAQKIQLSEQNKSITERCEQLSENLNTLTDQKFRSEEMLEEQVNLNIELDQRNKRLLELVKRLEQLHGNDLLLENRGRQFTEVGQRQQHRILKGLKTKEERLLWFAKTFGLDVSSIELKDETGFHHAMKYKQVGENTSKSYRELTQDEKDVVKQVTFVTDRFCIGEAAYHELTMGESGADLPARTPYKTIEKGVEKNNDDCSKIHFFKSNKWDAAKDVLLANKRLENLAECRRKPRAGTKRNADYWSSTIKASRQAKREALKTPESAVTQDNELDTVNNMTSLEIQDKFKEMGDSQLECEM